jgi:hypothetical protein
MAKSEISKKVVIASKLPNGLVLHLPMDPEQKVTIRGLSDAQRGTNGQPIAVPYVTTYVDEEFWNEWKLQHGQPKKMFAPLASGAIWEAKDEDQAKGIAKEQQKRKTGLEPLSPTAEGVKPEKE